MPLATIVANSKGGVGKTLTAATLARLSAERSGRWPRLVELDQPRLAHVEALPVTVRTIDPRQDVESLRDDPDRAARLFNPVYDELLAGDAVVDTGANVIGGLLDWAELSALPEACTEDGIRPSFVFVLTPDTEAIASALNDLEEARAVFGAAAGYAVVLNDLDGSGFERFRGLRAWEVLDRHANDGVVFARLPRANSLLVRHVTSRRKLVIDAVDRFDTYADELGLNRPARNQERKWVRAWFEAAREALAPLVAGAETPA